AGDPSCRAIRAGGGRRHQPPLVRRRAFQSATIRTRHLFAEAGEDHALDATGSDEKTPRLADRDLRRLLDRIAIRAAADGRKGDAADPMLQCELQAISIAGGQKFRLPSLPAVPDRSDGVNDVARRQSVAAGDARLAGGASADGAAFLEQLRPGSAMNRAVHPAATQKGRVRSVDDRVHREFRDVGVLDLDVQRPNFAMISYSPFVTGWTDNRTPLFTTSIFSSPRVFFSVSRGTTSGNFFTKRMSTIDHAGSFSGRASRLTSASPLTPAGSALEA